MESEAIRAMAQVFVGIAGAGRVAQALGKLLYARGEPVVAIASRSVPRARRAAAFIGAGVKGVGYGQLPLHATRLLIAVPDDAVAAVARTLAAAGMKDGAAAHTCGVYGVEVLAPLASRGVACATLHPLQTVSSAEQGVASLRGAVYVISGEGRAVLWVRKLVRLLEGRPLVVRPDAKPLYHAAAVMASNYLIVLIDVAVRLMGAAGIPPKEARKALAPLIRSSVENALRQGPGRALTGPVERGDIETVAAHLKALNTPAVPAGVLELYRLAGMHALQLARSRGLPASPAGRLEKLLEKGGPIRGGSRGT